MLIPENIISDEQNYIKFSLPEKILHFLFLYSMGQYVHRCSMHAKGRGRWSRMSSLLLPCGAWALSSGCQTWRPESLSIQPSPCLKKETFMITNPKHLTSEDMVHHSQQQQKWQWTTEGTEAGGLMWVWDHRMNSRPAWSGEWDSVSEKKKLAWAITKEPIKHKMFWY